MRTVPLMLLLTASSCAGDAFGIRVVGPTRSTDPYFKGLTVRFERHTKREVFALERVHEDGRVTSSSTILYFRRQARDLQDFGCLALKHRGK